MPVLEPRVAEGSTEKSQQGRSAPYNPRPVISSLSDFQLLSQTADLARGLLCGATLTGTPNDGAVPSFSPHSHP